MLSKVGWSFLFVSFVTTLFALFGALFNLRINHKKIIKLSFFGVLLSYITLVLGFALDKFYILAVYQYSEKQLELIYKISASWSGLHGSLLFWTTNLLLFVFLGFKKFEVSKIDAIFIYLSSFFLTGLSLFVINPFEHVSTSGVIPPDGLGLNPLLHNLFMLAHPVFTYLGLNSTVYLLLKNSHDANEKRVDNLEAFGWICLTIGITLGGMWAYLELGWGGYWAWDPVENSSLMPWLTYTAYLHLFKYNSDINIRRFIAILTHFLAILGTFITRTGFVNSVHTFSNSELGWYLKFYVFGSFALLVFYFLKIFKVKKSNLNFYESVMTLQSLTFVFYALSILWGVLYGPLLDLFFGEQIVLGIPFFDKISLPYFGIILGLIPFGINFSQSKNTAFIIFSFLLSLVASSSIYIGFKSLSIIEMFFLLLFIFNSICLLRLIITEVPEVFRKKLVSKAAIYFLHLCLTIFGFGVFFSYNKKIEVNLKLSLGVPETVLNHTLIFQGLEVVRNQVYEEVKAKISVDNVLVTPASRYYFKKDQVTAEIGLISKFSKDMYLALVEIGPSGDTVSVKLYLNPWINLVWLGLWGIILSYAVYRIEAYFRL